MDKIKTVLHQGKPPILNIGDSVGNMLIIRRLPNKKRLINFLCLCSCGNEIEATSDRLLHHHNPKRSCGGSLGRHKKPNIKKTIQTT